MHVDLIDVGALLAIDLNVHEKFIHHGGSRPILETFVRHDVAPMAGCITDG
jgi:hypothetical protein